MAGRTKVFWGTPERDLHGNALGYATHNAAMIKHTAPFIENDPESRLVLQIVSGDHFTPVPGRVNVLFTMWEFLDVPPSYQKALAQADYVIVPSRFCRDIFLPYCKRRPYVCQEGIEPEDYTFAERKVGNRFRFLWVGAPNPRKGYGSVLQVAQLAERFPQMEFYLKTTVKKLSFFEALKATRKHWREIIDPAGGWQRWLTAYRRIPSPWNANKVFCYGTHKNVFVDTRKLSKPDLNALYQSAHCFLFPSMGEGWGLTLCEAMATGAPCVAIDKTGCADFFDEDVGYVIKTSVQDIGALDNYGLKSCRAHIPDTQSLLDQMMLCAAEYEKAKVKGKRASDRIRSKFTWARSGQRLGDILREIEELEGQRGQSRS